MRFSSRFADILVDLGAGAPTRRYSQALSPLPSPVPSSPVVIAGVPISSGDGDESVMSPVSDGGGEIYG